jgi:hypothetical protein
VVQGALKLILEPIFDADFKPGLFGYRPRRTAHAAIKHVAESIALAALAAGFAKAGGQGSPTLDVGPPGPKEIRGGWTMKMLKNIGAALALCAMPMAFGCLMGGQGKLLEAPSADQVSPGVAVMGHMGLSEDALAAAKGCCEVGSDCADTSKNNCSDLGGAFYPDKSCKQPCWPNSGCCK